MNQLGVILHGRATAVAWLKVALTYLTPLLSPLSGFYRPQDGLLSSSPHHRGDEWRPQIPTNQQALTTVKGIRQWMKRN